MEEKPPHAGPENERLTAIASELRVMRRWICGLAALMGITLCALLLDVRVHFSLIGWLQVFLSVIVTMLGVWAVCLFVTKKLPKAPVDKEK